MSLSVFLRGVLLGLMIAAPVGPVGLLCIRRTLQKGILLGFSTGFGAALADFLFAGIATLGVASVLDWVKTYSNPIYTLGGLLLLFIGWHTWRDKPHLPQAVPKTSVEGQIERKIARHLGQNLKAVFSSFLITLTNPATLFGTLAVVAAFGGLKTQEDSLFLIGGIFLGSSLWWGLLAGGTACIRHRLTEKNIIKINKITAALLFPLGLWALFVGICGFLGYGNPVN